MADVWLGRFSRWVEKLFNAKGGPQLIDLSNIIQPVISLQPGNEERYLIGWNRFCQLANAAQNAANSGATRLRNPAGSNVIVVVEKLLPCSQGQTFSFFQLQQGPATTDLTSLGSGFRQDTRGNPNSTAILSLQNVTPPNLATNIATLNLNAQGKDFIITTDQELVLLPGDALQLIDLTVNEQILVHWMWRERALESSELT